MTTSTMRRSGGLSALRMLGVAALAGLAAWAAAPATGLAQSCVEPVLQAEHDHDIPPGLLLAMSLVESGGSGDPHAFALNLGGRAMFATDARDLARRLNARRGGADAYVGCLQISVRHHRARFDSMDDMADPVRNTAYAARYLQAHFKALGDWGEAVQRYQGGGVAARRAYQCKVWKVLETLDPVSAELIVRPGCAGGSPPVAPRVLAALKDNMDVLVAQVR